MCIYDRYRGHTSPCFCVHYPFIWVKWTSMISFRSLKRARGIGACFPVTSFVNGARCYGDLESETGFHVSMTTASRWHGDLTHTYTSMWCSCIDIDNLASFFTPPRECE